MIIPVLIWLLVGGLDLTNGTITRILIIYFAEIVIVGHISYFLSKQCRIKSAEVSTKALYELIKDNNSAIYKKSFLYFDKNETS